jgi:hypothetical protein
MKFYLSRGIQLVPDQIGWIRHLQLVPSRRLKGKAQSKPFSTGLLARIIVPLPFRSWPDYESNDTQGDAPAEESSGKKTKHDWQVKAFGRWR